MKVPESLETLVEHGIIQEVVRPLMSGKEAHVYVVIAGGEECVAKVYKEAFQRTFKHRVEYTEGRRMRSSRDRRAVNKRTRHGRKQDEAAWRTAEVDMIYRLRDAKVRVPEPLNFVDGVLVMELVKDVEGDPAPRLGDLRFEPREAYAIYRQLIQEVVRMLCAGVIHGDLSVFNVLMGVNGPVVIDFPQSVDAARNQGARKLLLRDVDNLHRFLERYAPEQPMLAYAEEMWALYESNRLQPDTQLCGDYRPPDEAANTEEVLALIDDANLDEQIRRHGHRARVPERLAEAPKPMREVVDFTKEARTRPGPKKRVGPKRGARPGRPRKRAAEKSGPPGASVAVASEGAAPKKRRGRRRRTSGAALGAEKTAPGSQDNRSKKNESAASEASVPAPKRRRRKRSRKRAPSE